MIEENNLKKDDKFFETKSGIIEGTANEINSPNLSKISENQLKSINDDYKDLFDNSLDAIFILNDKFELIKLNNEFQSLFAYNSELQTTRFQDIILNESDKLLFEDKIQANGFIKDFEIDFIKSDGNNFLGILRINSRLDKVGKVLGYQGVIRDISQSKSVYKDLIESESRFRELCELLPEVVFEIDNSGNVKFMNRAGFELLGINQDDFHGGLSAVSLMKQEYLSTFEADMQKLGRNEIINGSYYEAIRKDGTSLPVEIYLSPIISNNVVVGGRGIVIDITEKKAMLGSLEKAANEYFTIFNNSTIGIIRFDLNSEVTDVNPAMELISGILKERMIGKKIFDRVKNSRMIEAIKKCLNGKVSSFIGFHDIDGFMKASFIDAKFNPIILANGEVCGGIGIVEDISESVELEKAIMISEERYRHIYENTPVMLHSIDDQGRLVSVSNYWLEVMGYSRKEVIGRKSVEFLTVKSQVYAQSVLKEFYKTGILKDVHYQFIRKDGTTIDVLLSAIAEYSENNVFVRSLAVIQDITKLMKMQESLQHSEEMYRILSTKAPVSIMSFDANGIIQFANDYHQKKYANDESFVGKNISDLTYFKTANIEMEISSILYGEILDLNEVYVPELPNGISGYINLRGVPIFKDEKVIGGIIILDDISERKKSEEALRDSEESYRRIFELTPALIILVDKSGKIIDVNGRLNDWLGYSPSEIIGKTPNDIEFLEPSTKENIMINFRKKFDNQESLPYIIEIISKDGSKFKGQVFSILVRNQTGEILYDLVMVSDITAMIEAEEKVKELNRELEQRVVLRTIELKDALENLETENEQRKQTQYELIKTKEEIVLALEKEKELSQLKTRFISMISHEYRTPLTVILTSTYLLEKLFGSDNYELFMRQLEKIRISLNLMTKLLEDVLFIGKSDSKKLKYNPEKLDIKKLIAEIIEETNELEINKHEYIFETDDYDYLLNSDMVLLRQIFGNLITNASKYSDTGTAISVELIKIDDSFQVTISDQGRGISPEDLVLIFDPFHRGSNIGATQGTGLGLSIVKRCIDIMGGTILMDSILNQGTTITVKLPLTFI
ncbi:MAG: PAS domain-containing sensor histidine kinase [Candidatus Kapabacteria bacterium]|nr:PAS domain-containing sensor histidine kinase [Candidatus Kapabacteria bacterium]